MFSLQEYRSKVGLCPNCNLIESRDLALSIESHLDLLLTKIEEDDDGSYEVLNHDDDFCVVDIDKEATEEEEEEEVEEQYVVVEEEEDKELYVVKQEEVEEIIQTMGKDFLERKKVQAEKDWEHHQYGKDDWYVV